MESEKIKITTPVKLAASHQDEATHNEGTSDVPHLIQPKLTVGSPDDPLESEADSVADQVTRMPGDAILNFTNAKSTINRKCADCEKEEKEGGAVQRKESGGDTGSFAPSIVNEVVNSSGNQMDDSTRSFMESRFNYDFSDVKIHTDDAAAKSAAAINAQAYTTGKDVVFNSNQYNPTSNEGKWLLAHELAHVVQQNNEPEGEAKRKIRRRSLRSATLRHLCGSDEPVARTPPSGFLTLNAGESKITITTDIRWDRPANCPDGGTFFVTLFRRRSIIWDDNTDGEISYAIGSRQTRTWTGLPSDGEYYAEIRSANTNPNCCLTGSIDIDAS